MVNYTTIYNNDIATTAYYGDTLYDQRSIWNLAFDIDHSRSFGAYSLADSWNRASYSTVRSISSIYSSFGDPVMAFYHDCAYTPEVEYEFHHFRCSDPSCLYCELVAEGMQFGYDQDSFITYERYTQRWAADDDVLLDYIDLWTVNDPINQEDDSEDDEYEDEYDDESEEDDYDEYEDEYDDEYSAYNKYGYDQADIVNRRHYDGVCNAWIAPNGTMYYVPDYRNHGIGHWDTARALGFDGNDPVNEMESAGYIHLSSYYSTTHRFHYVPDRPTREQKEVAQLYCEVNDLPLPESLESAPEFAYVDPDQNTTIKPFTYWTRVEDSTLPRSLRDRFYPLSGD